jgi:hypothetical protein
MNLPKISIILIFFLIFSIILIIANFILYDMVKLMCLEEKEVPIRWESQGLFGVLTAIPTTEENMDEMGRICIRTGEPSFFSLSENLEFAFNKLNRK